MNAIFRIVTVLLLAGTLGGCAGFSPRGYDPCAMPVSNVNVHVGVPLGRGGYLNLNSFGGGGMFRPECIGRGGYGQFGESHYRLLNQAAYNQGVRDGRDGMKSSKIGAAPKKSAVPTPNAFQSGGMNGPVTFEADYYILDRNGQPWRYDPRPGETFPPIGSSCQEKTVTAGGDSFETLFCILPDGRKVLNMKGYREEQEFAERLRETSQKEQAEKDQPQTRTDGPAGPDASGDTPPPPVSTEQKEPSAPNDSPEGD